jgi:hypothetical protein
MHPEPLLSIPEWLVHSGLPARLNGLANSPAAWPLFRAIVEQDLRRNPSRPGIVEATLAEIAAPAGIDPERIPRLVPALRRARAVRCFLPETAEETALFQVLCPLETPVPAAEVARTHPAFARVPLERMRYATATDAPPPDPSESLKKTVDDYFDLVSMRMNAFTLDDLRLIAQRYDRELVLSVFDRARKRSDRPGLGWIMAELRKEDAARRVAPEERPG